MSLVFRGLLDVLSCGPWAQLGFRRLSVTAVGLVVTDVVVRGGEHGVSYSAVVTGHHLILFNNCVIFRCVKIDFTNPLLY